MSRRRSHLTSCHICKTMQDVDHMDTNLCVMDLSVTLARNVPQGVVDHLPISGRISVCHNKTSGVLATDSTMGHMDSTLMFHRKHHGKWSLQSL